MTRSQRQHGFTLLEILVAFMMLALVGGALLQLFQGGLQNLTRGDAYTRAALLADSTLSELRAKTDIQPGVEDGVSAAGYHTKVTLTPYPETADGPTTLLKADVVVRWDEGDAARDYRVSSLLLPRGRP